MQQFQTQKDVVMAFNRLVDNLIEKIKIIEKENPDPLMAATKTHRLITKWFNHGGKV